MTPSQLYTHLVRQWLKPKVTTWTRIWRHVASGTGMSTHQVRLAIGAWALEHQEVFPLSEVPGYSPSTRLFYLLQAREKLGNQTDWSWLSFGLFPENPKPPKLIKLPKLPGPPRPPAKPKVPVQMSRAACRRRYEQVLVQVLENLREYNEPRWDELAAQHGFKNSDYMRKRIMSPKLSRALVRAEKQRRLEVEQDAYKADKAERQRLLEAERDARKACKAEKQRLLEAERAEKRRHRDAERAAKEAAREALRTKKKEQIRAERAAIYADAEKNIRELGQPFWALIARTRGSTTPLVVRKAQLHAETTGRAWPLFLNRKAQQNRG